MSLPADKPRSQVRCPVLPEEQVHLVRMKAVLAGLMDKRLDMIEVFYIIIGERDPADETLT